MILSVEELRTYLTTAEEDSVLEAKLQALESTIKRYTNNDFTRYLTPDGDYPMDIKMGMVNMMQWDLNHRDKVGIASESISRHTVNYIDMNQQNCTMGYPVSLIGFLKPYKRARFGNGVGV